MIYLNNFLTSPPLPDSVVSARQYTKELNERLAILQNFSEQALGLMELQEKKPDELRSMVMVERERIKQLEKALESKKAHIEELNNKYADYNKHTPDSSGIAVVLKMRNAGDSEQKIAAHLKEQGLSYSHIGALLHNNPLGTSNEAVNKHAKRLLGIP